MTEMIGRTTMPMDYLHTCPNPTISCHANKNMTLKTTVDAAYLVQPKARTSQEAAAHYHLGREHWYRINGAIDVLCKTIKDVVISAAKAETSGICVSGRHACPIFARLEEFGHQQPKLHHLSKPTTKQPKTASTPKCAKNSPNLLT